MDLSPIMTVLRKGCKLARRNVSFFSFMNRPGEDKIGRSIPFEEAFGALFFILNALERFVPEDDGVEALRFAIVGARSLGTFRRDVAVRFSLEYDGEIAAGTTILATEAHAA